MSDSSLPDEWLEAANLHATVAQLLSTVIHQVNNALQTIGGHAELLKTDVGVTETTKRRANTITGVNERTAAMLASFQVFTRPPLESDVYNLREVVERALAFRHYGLGRARIQAVVEGLDHAPVRAELRPLTQAMLNIILNAEQALSGRQADNRIRMVIARESASDGQDWVTATVEDNGPGPQAPGLGDAGSLRGGQVTLGANNHLGLGMAAVRHIIARFGGRVRVEAVPAGGTRVTIALPAASEKKG